MNTKNRSRINKLAELGVFTAKEAYEALGISQPTLYRLERDEELQKVARGYFVHPGAEINYEHLDYIIACKTFGNKSAIGGLSALSYYKLIEQVPQSTWVLTPPEKTKSANSRKYRLIRTKLTLNIEIIKKKQFKIVSLERSLVEGLKHESKIGKGLVFGAIKYALKNNLTTEHKITKTARKLKIMNILEKKWELIIA